MSKLPHYLASIVIVVVPVPEKTESSYGGQVLTREKGLWDFCIEPVIISD
jgi:hypothetical protein